jgi:trimethylamine---corrinoid protein Co-methyltransferase
MTDRPVRARALDDEACVAIHAATLEILEGTGVEVQHERTLRLLGAAGARVDGTRVRIPSGLVDQALATAPRRVVLSSRSPAQPLDLHAGVTYYGTGSDCLYVLGPDARDRRPATLGDVEEMAALQEKLADIDFVMSMAHPHELDPRFAPIAQFAAMLRGTSKPVIMVPEHADDLELFKEMAAVCGAEDSWAVYAMPTPPLQHGRGSAERLVRCAELDVPMVYATALLQGANAPASPAAFLVVTNTEMLSGLVISQLAKPGAPYVYGVSQGAMNLRTAVIVYAAPESMAAQQASADLAAYYGLPTFGYGGCSDAEMLDDQWAIESGMTLLTAALAGVTLLHDLGYVASGTASSFESVVLMDELARWVKAYLRGVTIDEESLAVEEIAAVGPGGSHLSRKYSRRHYRDFFLPGLIAQESHDAWEGGGGGGVFSRASPPKTEELRAGERAYAPAPDALRELDRLVEKGRELRLQSS